MLGNTWGSNTFLGSTSYNDLIRNARASYGEVYKPFFTSAPRLSRMDVPEVSDPNVPVDAEDKAWGALSGKEKFSRVADVIAKALMVRGSQNPSQLAASILSEVQQAKAARKQQRLSQSEREKARADEAKQFNLRQEEAELQLGRQQQFTELERQDQFDREGRAIVQDNVEYARNKADRVAEREDEQAFRLGLVGRQESFERGMREDARRQEQLEREEKWLMEVANPRDAARIALKRSRGEDLDATEQATVELAEKMFEARNVAEQQALVFEHLSRVTKIPYEEVGEDPVTGKKVYRTMTLEEAQQKLPPAMQSLIGVAGAATGDPSAQLPAAQVREYVRSAMASNPNLDQGALVSAWLNKQGQEGVGFTDVVVQEFEVAKQEIAAEAAAEQTVRAQLQAIETPEQALKAMQMISTAFPFSQETRSRLLNEAQSVYSVLMSRGFNPVAPGRVFRAQQGSN